MRMLGTHEWTASKTMPSFFQHRDHAGTCGCHGSDIMAEGSDEAVQAGGFSLKEVSTDSHGSDPTTKHHDKERRIVLMTLRRLRYTRGRGDAVSTASEGQLAAAVNAVVNATWLKPRVGTLSLADPGGCGLAELGDGRLPESGPRTGCLNCTGWAPVWWHVELNANDQRVAVRMAERMLQQRRDRGCE